MYIMSGAGCQGVAHRNDAVQVFVSNIQVCVMHKLCIHTQHIHTSVCLLCIARGRNATMFAQLICAAYFSRPCTITASGACLLTATPQMYVCGTPLPPPTLIPSSQQPPPPRTLVCLCTAANVGHITQKSTLQLVVTMTCPPIFRMHSPAPGP